MVNPAPIRIMNDDPRSLRVLVARASGLAEQHAVQSVLVGLAAPDGDLLFPEFIDYLKSALRVEDGIFRMTRERAVIHLADVDVSTATSVIHRLIGDFQQEFPALADATIKIQCFGVTPEAGPVSVKDVLTVVFGPPVFH